jgi:tetratricopeptide (TPR) repeat protein
MPNPLPKELVQAKELMDQARLDEALEIIEKFERGETIGPEDHLSTLLIKGKIYLYKRQTRKALQIYEVAYQISHDLGLVPESIEVLIGKANIGFIGDLDNASTYIKAAERGLNSLADDPSIGMLSRNLLNIKSWILFQRLNFNKAEELAQECLKLQKEEKFTTKLDLAGAYNLLGWINLSQVNRTKALEYAMESLELNKELTHDVGIADDYSLIANIYHIEGDYDQALQYCRDCLSIKRIGTLTRLVVLRTLSLIYRFKGELNRAIKYTQQAIALAEEFNFKIELNRNLIGLGYLYRLLGKNNLAIESFEHSLILSEKWGYIFLMANTLSLLIWTYIDENSRETAKRYFSRLSELYDQTKDKENIDISITFLLAKASLLKSSTRMRDRVEAQTIFKGMIDRTGGDPLIYSLSNLCDLLLEELSINNDPEILDEITPLIAKSLNIAETAHNYGWLAETKLLQAKLALIQMNTEEAKKLMTQAQRIADLHGLNLLAWGISSEHDKLLEQIDAWDRLKKEEAPFAELVKLASTSGVLERIQGRRAVEPVEPVDEQSTVLLILSKGGVLIFSYPFSTEWNFDEDIFSSFLSAFASFSTDFFSKGLDRVKFGDEMMLMESIGSFSFCYLFKGQTYLAKQKLTKFTEEVQKNSTLWQSLQKHYQTSQILELKDTPQLESLITETFITPHLLESQE